ncbi:putative bifunctional diguanylate cyclase/phosphodiesterase [Acuticoccus sp.]|uniref:putative bifunctional diguanylate cyclase/phosphodiesterase n=1 Tax=Acuticoccus sp. TaxID=1904378 RepID=UPI003B521874
MDLSDPFAELAASACDLLADTIGARHCGVVDAGDRILRAASSEFLHLPAAARTSVVAAVVEAVLGASVPEDVARSSLLVPVATDVDLGGRLDAFLLPETELAIFAVTPATDRAVDAAALRHAAVAVLPIIYGIEGLRVERHALVRAARLLGHVEELAKVGAWERDPGTGRLVWSAALYGMHGLTREHELTVERMLELYPSPARERLSQELKRAVAEGGGFDVTAPMRTPAGEERIMRTVGRTRAADGKGALYGITQDVTATLSTERRLWWAANHDPVTSLPNRLLFGDRIATAAQRARRDGGTFALVRVEVDDRQRDGAAHGFTVPDKHMLDIAARLSTVTRQSDTVARVSINEFAILLFDVDGADALDAPLSRLEAEVADIRRLEPEAGLSIRVGVAFYPQHAADGDELNRAAEIALAHARTTPDAPIQVFDRQVASNVAERRQGLLARAGEAVSQGEFVPYYQPQVDIETREVVGVEALVRWQTQGLLLDAKDFGYVLADHEVGSRIGRAVLDGVIADVARLRDLAVRPLRVSVNASRTEVLRNDFLDTFLARTRSGNLAPEDFIIEITEDVIVGIDDQSLHDKVSFLASSGAQFALDDFGTGYASLIHMASFPISEIKIDKEFVFGIETDARKRAIVKGILEIARSMGLSVIAEGVETVDQEEALRAVGCRIAQGYRYAVPLPFAEFAAMLQRG